MEAQICGTKDALFVTGGYVQHFHAKTGLASFQRDFKDIWRLDFHNLTWAKLVAKLPPAHFIHFLRHEIERNDSLMRL